MIVFDVSDVDTPSANRSLWLFSSPYSGSLHRYNATPNAAGSYALSVIKGSSFVDRGGMFLCFWQVVDRVSFLGPYSASCKQSCT